MVGKSFESIYEQQINDTLQTLNTSETVKIEAYNQTDLKIEL